MSQLLAGALSSGAKQRVLEYKVLGVRAGILTKASGTGSSIANITADVLALSKNYDPIDNPTPYITVADGTQKGVYVGTVSGASSPLKVLIRKSGQDNGIEDGLGDEIYGVLSEAAGVVSLAFKKSNGADYVFADGMYPSGTSLDILFVEFVDLFQADPAALLLMGGISGVVDATASNALAQFIDDLASTANGEGASLIGIEDPDNKITATTVEGALVEIATDIDNLVTDLASTANGDGASLIGVEDPDNKITATTVEGALVEIATDIDNLVTDLASTANGDGASLIGVEDPDNKITATTVEGALVEIATDVDNLITDLASTANGDGASLIGIEDVADQFSSTTVEGALAEALDAAQAAQSTASGAATSISNHLSDTTDAHDASAISIADAGGKFTATDVEGALAELIASDSLIASATQELIADEADARVAADGALATDITNLQTLSGRPDGSTHLGTFTGSTIADNSTIKAALQALETSLELSNANIGPVTPKPHVITLTADDITNKYFDLPSNWATDSGTVNRTLLFPLGHLPQGYGEDFIVIEGAVPGRYNRVSWDGYGMESLELVAGNKVALTVY